jgi:hypothetical protein
MSAVVDPLCLPNWRDLYLAALFEKDRQRLPGCIASAERAVTLRARELFTIPDDANEEREGLEDALYALRALRHCLDLKTNESDRVVLSG